MSEAMDILAAMETQFRASDTLSYIQRHYQEEDPIDADAFGYFPYINLSISDLRVEDADNIASRFMERHIYPVIIMFANRHDKKRFVKTGDTNFKGVWDIYDDIISTIETDQEFGGVVSKEPIKPDFSAVVEHNLESGLWIGRAALIFEVYTDTPKV